MSRKIDPWVRRFEVSDPCLHQKGYTIYKITSTVFPRSSPEASTEVVVWRRFSEIKRLHKALRIFHQNLHLKGEFPTFPKEKLFGRFEPSVIEERRQSALNLLQFVAQNPPLFTSQIFVAFFEAGRQSVVRKEDERPNGDEINLMQPVKLFIETDKQTEQEPAVHEGSTLSGVWQYRQTADDISLDSNEESDDQETLKDIADNRVLNADLSAFDPYCPTEQSDPPLVTEPRSSVTGSDSNAWLLSALATCSTFEDSQVISNGGLQFPQAFADYEETDSLPVGAKQFRQFVPDVHTNSTNNRDQCNLITDDSKNSTVEETKTDYTTQANRLLISARHCETTRDFHSAFDLYKRVIETLLNGLKEEFEPLKISAVRRDITKYLSYAEIIYEKHLKDQSSSGDIRSIHYSPSNELSISSRQRQLERYKVLGIIGKVLLVLDCATNSSYVIKVLSKSVRLMNANRQSNFLHQIDHMVRLVRYHETDDSIFLVLQHAVGGRLWNFVGSYLQNISSYSDGGAVLEGEECHSPTNVYVGRKFVGKSEIEEVKSEFKKRSNSLKSSGDSSLRYVQFFTDYVSQSPENRHSRLAECQRVTYTNNSENVFADDSNCEIIRNRDSNKAKPHQPTENVTSGICYRDNVGDAVVWTNLKNVDTDELVSNAQRLMENVEETLRVSDKTNGGFEFVKPVSPTSNDSEQPLSPTFKGISRTRLRSRKSSEGDPFAVDRCPSVIRESSGSVELQRNRVRHFSSVFRQLDEGSSQTSTLPENYIRIWASEIIKCVLALHRVGIICKDLKPDNILLGEKGHVLLTYFSQWSTVDDHIDQTAKDNLYTAPELGGIYHISPSCDWWSVGALLFELFTGKTLVSCHQEEFNSHTQLHIPTQVSNEAESLLKGLLCYNPNERLGSGPMGIENIKSHPFFNEVDWS